MKGRNSSEMDEPAELRLLADRLEAVEGVFVSLAAAAVVVVVASCVPRMWLAMAENERGVENDLPPLP